MGAEVRPDGTVHFRLWAPKRRRVEVVLVEGGPGADARAALRPEGNGYFSGTCSDAQASSRYRFRLDDDGDFPDPASRFQPDGPHGPSQVVDPRAFPWTDDAWRGVSLPGQVIYEMHIGTFTRAGTWDAAARELPELASAGITLLELMPVADFPGRFGWGYDGVNLFAPTRLYGTPDDFRRFVDAAHGAGLGVLLDVVYNHFGPDGNYLRQFADEYVGDRKTEWGDALNFDGASSGPVREYVVANAGYWIDEFHLDGLRLDATQSMFDDSSRHVLADIAERVRAAAGGRGTIVVAENEPQHARLVRPTERGGYGLDAMWNDDFHHSALVAATGRDEAYYSDYRGTAQELLSATKHGFLYQGQWYRWQGKRRGTPAFDLAPPAFVHYLDNHDQVANSARGARLHQRTSPARLRAITALLLLAPQTPMLFQGQEFGASAPFLYFADHRPELAETVARGRAEFLTQFASAARPEVQATLDLPHDPTTFERCKLDFAERERHRDTYDLHRHLLELRRQDPCFAAQRRDRMDGAVLSEHALALRFFAEDGMDRLLLVNLGRTLHLDPAPEPLLAAPADARWAVRWSSEHPRYGGGGALHPDAAGSGVRDGGSAARERPHENWLIQGEAATVLVPEALTSPRA